MGAVLAWAHGLGARDGFQAEVVVCGPKAGGPPAERGGVPVRTLAAARESSYDIALSTWWTTAAALDEIDARRRAALLQNVEHRFYRPEQIADLTAAAATLSQPVDFLCVSAFLRDLVAELRPDARSFLVPPGIDKQVFRPAEPRAADGPLRVLVEGQPTLWFKGVEESLAAVGRMREPATVTVAVHDPESVETLAADRVVGGLDAGGMAELYAEHDVMLKTPRFEGLGLPPIEAFHTGRPCVVTPYTGHEEYVEHGTNGLVVGFDDPGGLGAALDLLARDAGLRERLARGALATAARWPDAAESLDSLVAALEQIAVEPPPKADRACAARAERLRSELVRERDRQLAGALAWREHELMDTRATLADTTERLHKTRFDLDNVLDSRAYRLGVALRRLAFWRRGG